jgi:hypothetical protein
MASKKKKFYVDVTNDFDERERPLFKKFGTLRKAVRFAIKHGLTEEQIVDAEGQHIDQLNVADPQWMTHREIETLLDRQKERADRAEKRLAKAEDARRTRQITLIQAGYVPIELITERLTNVHVERNGIHDHATVTLTLHGDPGAIDAEHKRRPFTALLEALRNGLQK